MYGGIRCRLRRWFEFQSNPVPVRTLRSSRFKSVMIRVLFLLSSDSISSQFYFGWARFRSSELRPG
ncbi:hypothetical protein Hanom_Chr06g00557931 [Helianthus anomalus]